MPNRYIFPSRASDAESKFKRQVGARTVYLCTASAMGHSVKTDHISVDDVDNLSTKPHNNVTHAAICGRRVAV